MTDFGCPRDADRWVAMKRTYLIDALNATTPLKENT